MKPRGLINLLCLTTDLGGCERHVNAARLAEDGLLDDLAVESRSAQRSHFYDALGFAPPMRSTSSQPR